MIGARVLLPLVAGVVACVALGARPLAAQDEKPDSEPRPLWVGVALLSGDAHLDGNASRGWQQVGNPGPSLGASVALGFDTQHLGGALGAEAATLKVGRRSGSSMALAATLRWRVAKRRTTQWQTMGEIGYVRLGFGSVRVSEAELPSGLFKNGVQGDVAGDNDLSLHGNGIRLGTSLERPWRLRTKLVFGIGVDVVHFDAATYEGSDKSLSNPGWGAIPRIFLGVHIPSGPMMGHLGSGPTRNPN
jgi:hypothetical protein